MIGTVPQFRANSSKLNRQPVWWSLWRSGGWGGRHSLKYISPAQSKQHKIQQTTCVMIFIEEWGGGGKITLLSIYFPSTEQAEQNSTRIKIDREGDTCITDREEFLFIKHLA